MEKMDLFSILFILACLHVHSVQSANELNCTTGSNFTVGGVLEGYEGDLENLTNISPNDHLVLEWYLFPGVEFLELVHSDGDSNATVRTKKPLDAEELKETRGILFYSVTCSNTGLKNNRTVYVLDINDNSPIFQNKTYSATVSEVTPVGTVVLRVRADDADVSPENNNVTYSILPPVPDDFDVTDDGNIRLTKRLNYNDVQQYIFTVEAKHKGGLRDTATVRITVEDSDNLNLYFDHSLYKASIKEKQVGQFSNVTPEAIKAQNGDTGEPVVYSIIEVLPNEYERSFEIDRNSGVISVKMALDREEIDQITAYIQAAQWDDANKTADAEVSITIEDVNDNAPVFSIDIYIRSILVKDAKVGEVLLTVSATDKDAGSNAIISYSFSKNSSMVALDAETGDITLTSDLTEVTEDTLLTLTAIATDQGTPAQSDEAEVLIYFEIYTFNESVAFENSSYNFIIKENEPEATIVGKVKALTGSPLVTVNYNMKSHRDIFSVDAEGTIKALRPLDKEEEEWYILAVEAIDSRTPPNTAETTVRVQVENVNEAPMFDAEIYEAEIFSIAPYKFPIVRVQASDPDVGESSELQYSLLESTSLLDVEANTGQIYVLDAASVGDGLFTFHAKATDKHGLSTTTTVQIEVKQSVHRDIVAVISLNQPVYIVEKKIPEMEDSMEKALGLTVKILSVRDETGTIFGESTAKTYVSFIAMDSSGAVIPATELKDKLHTDHNALTSELEKVFGPGLEIKVEEGSGSYGDSSQAAVIALSVLFALSIAGLIALSVVFVSYWLKMKNDTSSPQKRSSIEIDANFDRNPETGKSVPGSMIPRAH